MNKLRKKQLIYLLIHIISWLIVLIIIWTQFSGPPENHEFVPEGWGIPDARVYGSLMALMWFLFGVIMIFTVPKRKMKKLQESDKLEPRQ